MDLFKSLPREALVLINRKPRGDLGASCPFRVVRSAHSGNAIFQPCAVTAWQSIAGDGRATAPFGPFTRWSRRL